MTRNGHGLYTLPAPDGGFADLRVGVLKSGFFPQWMKFLRHDTTHYPDKRPRKETALENVPPDTFCLLRDLFASMPEIDDLFAEVFDDPPAWVSVDYDEKSNSPKLMRHATAKKSGSTYGLFLDRSGKISTRSLENAGWPLAEIRRVDDFEGSGAAFRARVDHAGHDIWWTVIPTHSSPFRSGPNAPPADRGWYSEVQDDCGGDVVCPLDPGALHAEHLATHRRRRRGSVSCSCADVAGGLGASPARTLPREHRRRKRAHGPARKLAGLSSMGARNAGLSTVSSPPCRQVPRRQSFALIFSRGRTVSHCGSTRLLARASPHNPGPDCARRERRISTGSTKICGVRCSRHRRSNVQTPYSDACWPFRGRLRKRAK